MPGPSLELDWELGLFKALRAVWRAVAGDGGAAPLPGALDPGADLPRWTAFASVIAGRSVRVETTRGAGGVRGSTLLVPTPFRVVDDPALNGAALVVRLAIDATTAARRPRHPSADSGAEEAWASIEVLSRSLPLFEAALREAGALLLARPATAHPHEVAARAVWAGRAPSPVPPAPPFDGVLWGRVIEVDLGDGAGAAGADADAPPSEATERAAMDITDVRVKTLGEESEFQAPIHSFEKIELLESFNGHVRQLDGEDDLADHLEALEEVDLSAMVRGGPRVHSLLHAEIGLEAGIPDVADVLPGEHGLRYPEWDPGRHAYRPDWCTVYPTRLPVGPATGEAAASLVRQRAIVRRIEDQLRHQRQRRRDEPRALDGESLDLDAVVAAEVDRRAGRAPSPRVYCRQARHVRHVATTVLVDISLSADAWIDGARVWDITRDALWAYGEASHRVGDTLQILAFASQTRHHVRTFTVLDWHEPWTVGQRRLEALRPQGYTRIGPAVRHALAGLRRRPADARQLILLSDCKPTDYDRYEGSYGLGDVHRALEEGRRDQIAVFGLAVDDVARQRLPAMFGSGGWGLLRQPEDLLEAVARMARWRRI